MTAAEFTSEYWAAERGLKSFLYRLGVAPQEIEDLAQEAWMRAWSHRHEFRGDAKLSSYVCAIARNLVIDGVRRARPVCSLSAMEGFDPASAEDTAGQVEMRDEARVLLARLRRADRVLTVLRFYVGLSLEELAAHLKLPLGTVKSQLHRAGQTMREGRR